MNFYRCILVTALASAASATTATTAAAAAAATIFAGLSFIDFEVAAAELGAVETFDCVHHGGLRIHRHKGVAYSLRLPQMPLVSTMMSQSKSWGRI